MITKNLKDEVIKCMKQELEYLSKADDVSKFVDTLDEFQYLIISAKNALIFGNDSIA